MQTARYEVCSSKYTLNDVNAQQDSFSQSKMITWQFFSYRFSKMSKNLE